jgi:hypothetical protein
MKQNTQQQGSTRALMNIEKTDDEVPIEERPLNISIQNVYPYSLIYKGFIERHFGKLNNEMLGEMQDRDVNL